MAGFFASLFGPSKTPREMMREYKRMIDKTVRELDRERERMAAAESKTVAEMRQLAAKNQPEAVKIRARDLVRSRKYQTKFYKMRAEMQAVSLRLQTLQATATMTEAMRGVTRAMVQMNRQMNLPAMQRIMQEFEKQSEIMGMKEEIMSETIDDAMDEEGDEDTQAEELVGQVLDELGIKLSEQVGVGAGKIAPAAAEAAPAPGEDELQARLERLKRG